MKKFFSGISGKIYGGFALLIGVFAVNTVFNYIFIDKNQRDTNYNAQISQPSIVAINEFQVIILKSQSYTNSWVKTEVEDHPDKKALPLLLNDDYPEIKQKLTNLSAEWKDDKQKVTIKDALLLFDTIATKQKSVMSDLKSFDDYQDAMKIMTVGGMVDDEINQKITKLNGKINDLLKLQKAEANVSIQNMLSSFKVINISNILANCFVLVVGLVVAFLIVRSITNPVNGLKDIIGRLSIGELPQINIKSSKDEIGEMVDSTKKFVSVLEKRTDFAKEIGNGNYEKDFELLSENDILGHALNQMRDNLKKSGEEDRRRNWITVGIAQIGELLRQYNNDASALYDNVLRYLIKYLEANQGGLFLINNVNSNDIHIELVACYAFERKKFLEKRIEIGEGLVGQCVQEGEQIYLTDVPNDYINITSGIGSANPNCIIIMPLKYNDEILGVLEIASFKVFENYHVEFVSRVAESVASTISAVKVNETTKKLLEESQMQAEALKSQEEEMRQNLEELQATQEHQQRMERDLKENEKKLLAKIAQLEQK